MKVILVSEESLRGWLREAHKYTREDDYYDKVVSYGVKRWGLDAFNLAQALCNSICCGSEENVKSFECLKENLKTMLESRGRL